MLNNVLHLVLFVVFSTCSSTPLWRIETSPPSYIFGTIHIPHNRVWPYVSNGTREAFLSSTHFYAEIDAKNDIFWNDLLRCLVKKSTRLRRLAYLSTEAELLDTYLLEAARRLNKTVGGLESAEYYCENDGWRYNRSTIGDINRYFKELTVKKYICDEINSQYIQTLFQSNDQTQQFEHRDEQMSRRIHTLLYRSNTTNQYFFAIGVAHMLGKHKNLIVRLKALGYKITRICTDRNRIKKTFGCKKKKCLKKTSPINRKS